MNFSSDKLQKMVFSIVISLPLALTACNKAEPEKHDHEEHEGHDHKGHDHEEHDHEGHDHEEHDHKGHDHEGHDHEGHDHEGHDHEGHDHEGHDHEGHDHEGHDHEGHDHDHGSGAKHVIPEGYSVNFAVSNHPLLLLSEAVTHGTPTTVLKLLGAGDVGHHGSLSPSDIKAVKDSKYVVWFGKELESNLANTLTKAPNTVTILQDKTVKTLDHRDVKTEVISGTLDPHVWVDPDNAKAIVTILKDLHIKANPEYTKNYQSNADKFIKELDTLVKQHQEKRSETKKYWSSHDAFQYLEKSLNIELAGALTTDHEIPAKASQLVWLKNNRPYETMCLLAQSEPKEGIKNKLKPVLAKVLIEDMSNSKTYLEAWNNTATIVESCVK